MVNTVATDHVGVKANDLVSFAFSAILKYQKPQSKPYLWLSALKTQRQLSLCLFWQWSPTWRASTLYLLYIHGGIALEREKE
jgi:hypothetical protein